MGRYTLKLILTLIFSTVMAVGCGGSDTGGAEGSKQPPGVKGSIGVSGNSLDIIISENSLKYPISGACNFASKTPVVVSIEGVAIPINLDCQSDNTFSGLIDMSAVTSAPAVITISQATSSASLEIRNELVPLTVLALEALPNPIDGAPTHELTGTCDGSDASGSVPDVTIEITSLGISGSVPCTPGTRKSTAVSASCGESGTCGTFSFDFLMGTNTPRALELLLTQGLWKTSFTYAFATPVVSLALDALEVLNLSTAGSYVLSGKCDSSLEGQSLRIQIKNSGRGDIATIPPKQVLCVKAGDSANTFSVSFNLLNLEESFIIFYASYGREDASHPVANNITPLSFDDLASIVAGNISNYFVEGACDSSLSEQILRVFVKDLEVEVASEEDIVSLEEVASEEDIVSLEEIASEEVSCNSTLGAGFNTFSASFDLRDMPGTSVTFHASYGGESIDSSSIENEVVPLSLSSTTLLPLNLASASAYQISGRCDTSLGGSVTAALKGLAEVASQTSLCHTEDNTFSLSFDLRAVSASEIIFEVSHGSESVESSAVANNIVNLSLDPLTLVSITSANASAYRLSGDCDPSLFPKKVQVTMGAPDVTAIVDCFVDSTFSVVINASDIVSKPVATVVVTYGEQEQAATVINELIYLALTGNLLPLTGANQNAYTLTGVCKSALMASVTLTVLDTGVSSLVDCTDNQFSVSVDARNTNSDPVSMVLSHGSQSLNISVPSDVIHLSILPPSTPFNLASAANYTLTGVCDLTVASEVQVTLVDTGTNANSVSGTSVCASEAYSVSLDGRAITSNPVLIQVTHGIYRADAQVVNSISRLALNALPSTFNLATALEYNISGVCDFSLGEVVTISLEGTNVNGSPLSDTTPCLNDNTFSVTLDASAVTESSFMIQASYGAVTQTSASVSNNIVRFSLTQPTEPFNASTAGSYSIAGHCDVSLAGVESVTVTVQGTDVQRTFTCQSFNTFSVDLNLSSLAVGTPFVVAAVYGTESDQTASIANDVVALAFDPLITPLNAATAPNYNVSGSCDASLNLNVTVRETQTGAYKDVPCEPENTFTASFDFSTVEPEVDSTLTLRALYGGLEVDATLVNGIISLSIDASLPALNISNQLDYSISGDCDVSLASNTSKVMVTMGTPNVTATVDCGSDNRFVGSVNASTMTSRPNVTISVAYGEENITQDVLNELIFLGLRDGVSLDLINAGNKSNYTVTGVCNSSIGGLVTVTVDGSGASGTGPCRSGNNDNTDNTFSVSVDASGVNTESVFMTLTYGTQEAFIEVPVLRLALNPLPGTFNLATALEYTISGICDFALGEGVIISLEGTSVNGSPLGATTSCANDNTFSVTLDASAVTESSFIVQANHGSETQSSASVTNSIVRLSLTQPTELFNAGSASAYPLSGQCDSSVASNGSVLIGLQGTDISRSVNCSDNRFDDTLDVSAVKDLAVYPDTLVFEASYGGETFAAQAITNDYILLSLDTLGPWNSATAAQYEVSGVCDGSLSDLITVTVVGTLIAENASCLNDNTFTQPLDLSALDSATHSTITIQVEHDEQTRDQSINNNIVTLAFAGVQEPLTLDNRDGYTISGACDNSLGDVTIQVESPTLTATVTCASETNTFTAGMDLASITSGTMHIRLIQLGSTTVTQSVPTNTASNDATLSALSFEGLELTPAFDSETLSYTASTVLQDFIATATLNHEMARLVSNPAGTQSDKVATILFPLDSTGNHDLTLTVTAEDRVTEKTYTVTVTLLPQVLQLGTSLGALTDLNENSYTVTGTCNSFAPENVVVVMGDPLTVSEEVPCERGGIFSASIDAHWVVTSSATVRATQGEETVSTQVDNETVDSLCFSEVSPLATDVDYTLSGFCDTSAGDVTVVIGEPNVTTDITCESDGTFSGTLDVQAVSSHPAKVSLSQGAVSIETRVSNDIQRFVTVWNFPANYDFTLPLVEDYNYNFTVDWGDGSSTSEVTSFSDTDKTHTYADAGEYTVTIKGVCETFRNNGAGTKDKLLQVLNLGNMGWKIFIQSFAFNTNLTTVLGGNTSSVIDMEYMFRRATLADPDTSGWDTSNVTNMTYIFAFATSANPDTSGWDTSNMQGMSSIFYNATSANPDTSGWDTSNATTFGNMFRNARSANPDVSNWNTSRVTSIAFMFEDAILATPDTSRWDTSSLREIASMFRGARLANPDTSSWDFSNIDYSNSRLFSNTNLSVANYSKFLISLGAAPTSDLSTYYRVINVGNLQYNSTAAAAREALVNDSWTFTDGGEVTK